VSDQGGYIPTYWWRGLPNIGDRISPLIVEGLTGRAVEWVDKPIQGKLLAVGSILHLAARRGDTIWGAGLMAADAPIGDRLELKVLAVRGPLTRARLLADGYDCPAVYGDPSVLLPKVIARDATEVTHSLGVIPHYVDKSRVAANDPGVLVMDVQAEPESFLKALWSCERVVSSALHGIIMAEAYGIAADWVRLSDEVAGGNFKFRDYYEGTGRACPAPLDRETLYAERPWTVPRPPDPALLSSLRNWAHVTSPTG
jgi:pyruvyltransferase